MALNIIVDPLSFPEPLSDRMTKEDVWGKFTSPEDPISAKIHSGMVVARSYDYTKKLCPIWNDKVPYKSATIVCDTKLIEEVAYWIEFVQGADSIIDVKTLDDGTTAIRCEYMAW